MANSPTISIRIDREVLKELERQAKRERRTISNLAAMLLRVAVFERCEKGVSRA